MSQEIALSPVPAQSVTIQLNGQSCQILVYTLGTDDDAHLYFDLYLAGTPIANGVVCRNLQYLLAHETYTGFQGDFMFVDNQATQGAAYQTGTDPVYTGLGSQYELLYLLPSELPTAFPL